MRQPTRPPDHKTILFLFLLAFLTFPRTSVRAQLRPDAPVLNFLSDQLTDFGMAYAIPNGDFGPTRLAFTRQMQLWEPSYVAASWRGRHHSHAGVGAFTPHDLRFSRPLRKGRVAFAGADDQQALLLNMAKWNRQPIHARFSYSNDQRDTDYDEDGRNDGSTRRDVFGSIGSDWYDNRYQGSVGLRFFNHQGERHNQLQSRLERYDFRQTNRLDLDGYLSLSANIQLLAERAEHDFEDRESRFRRLTGAFQLSLLPANYNEEIKWDLTVDLLHREDRIRLPGISRDDREQFAQISSQFSWDVAPFRLRYNQQLRSSRTDGTVYRPHAEILWFPGKDTDLHVAAVVNRGGGYRNPLLSDAHLLLSRRAYATAGLRSEDFWRRGLVTQAKILDDQLELDLQAFHFSYARHTTIRYTSDNQITLGQTSGTTRRLFAAQAGYTLNFPRITEWQLKLYVNYRYDELQLTDPTGILLPARHAAWVRLEVPVHLGNSYDDWKLKFQSGYLRQSKVQGLDAEDTGAAGRSRLDASLRLDHQHYWIALRGEQLLRRDALVAYGFDPLAPAGEVPLGSEFSTLQGRRFTLAAGVGIGRR